VLGQGPSAPTKPAAIVNGEAIPLAEVDAVLKARPPAATPPTDTQKKQMQLEALALLIDDVIMQQFLHKNAPPIQPAEVIKRLEDMKTALSAQKKTVADFCRESGQTEEQLRTSIVNLIQWTAYVKAHLSDADVLKYYTENRDFFDQITVRASHIVLRIPANASDADRLAARAKLQAIRQEILTAKIDFAEAAKKYSQCPSAPQGGDLGYFPRKWAVEESFARAAFALKKGEISDVVQTDYGLHLIKVTDRKAGQPSTFDKIKDEVREIAAEEMRQELLAQQRKVAQVVVNIGEDSTPAPAKR